MNVEKFNKALKDCQEDLVYLRDQPHSNANMPMRIAQLEATLAKVIKALLELEI